MIARDCPTGLSRGLLGQNNDSITELADPLLPGRHGWLTANWLDSRGNWLTHVTRLNGATLRESRTVNGVNEYTTIDPDDLNSPPDPVSLTHDANGNLTQNPLAPNAGGTSYNGQSYVYDAENRLVKVTRTTDSQTLLEILYDAKGQRVGFRGHHTDFSRLSPLGADGRPPVLDSFSCTLARLRSVACRARRIGVDRFPAVVKRSGGTLSVRGPRRTCAPRALFENRRLRAAAGSATRGLIPTRPPPVPEACP